MAGWPPASGIRKDLEFAPDSRMAAILEDAAAVGNATARAIVFDTRDETSFIYDDRRWQTGFVGGDYRWLINDGVRGRNSTPARSSSPRPPSIHRRWHER
jgi:hypothetical protein